MKTKRFWCLLLLPILSFIEHRPPKEITVFLISDSTVADKPYANGNPEKGHGVVDCRVVEEMQTALPELAKLLKR